MIYSKTRRRRQVYDISWAEIYISIVVVSVPDSEMSEVNGMVLRNGHQNNSVCYNMLKSVASFRHSSAGADRA